MFTRKDYMEKRCSHAEYYRQFVTETVKKRVASSIGIERIKSSTDEHLNDIDLARWDAVSRSLVGEIRPLLPPDDWYSLSTGVCVAKQAARMLVEQA